MISYLNFFNFPVILKISIFYNFFFKNYDFFETTGKLKSFDDRMISHHFVKLNELIFKMFTVWGSEIVFDKIIEENCKKF